MQTIFVDTETYFTNTYTLTKLTVIEYIRDPQFKLHGVGIAIDDQEPQWFTQETITNTLAPESPDFIDWANSRVVLHNALFDALILTEHLGLPITHWSDTIGLAKSVIAVPKHNLDYLSKLLLKDEKTKDESGISMVNVGKKLVLSPEEDAVMGDYCAQDVNLTRQLYKLLRPLQTDHEERVLSATINWFAYPTLELDQELLQSELTLIQDNKTKLIEASGFTKAELSSNSIFVSKVEALGLEFPTKLNPKGQPIHATGKSDPEFLELKEQHPELHHIWDARDAIKSTLLESRVQTLQQIAQLGVTKTGLPSLPVPLNYFGASTGRWSGAGGLNLQNLPNLRTSLLRKCIVAPKDHVIVVVDSSQIELRVNMFWCGQTDMHDILASGKDLYKVAAAAHFGVPIEEVTKDQRSFGKLVSLALGYGQGAEKFKHLCASGPLGMDPFFISDDESRKAINAYRKLNHKVKETWAALDHVLGAMLHNDGDLTTFRGLTIGKECITLPDGVKLIYPHLQCNEGEWSYGFFPKISKIYGAKFLENIIQATARAIIADQLVKIGNAGYKIVHSVHDEFLLVCHENLADQCLADVKAIMSTTPDWIPGLVLSAEGAFDKAYIK